MATPSVMGGPGGVTQPSVNGMWQQPVQIHFQQQSTKRKLTYFKLDPFISQVVSNSNVYSVEEVVGASLALIEYRLSQGMPIGGYHSHLRFLLERASSKVHREQSLIQYDRFIRERAEIYGPAIMNYGDSEGINRYLGVGSLRAMSTAGGGFKKSVARSQGVCRRYNRIGRCRQSCKFRHVCDSCGEPHPKIGDNSSVMSDPFEFDNNNNRSVIQEEMGRVLGYVIDHSIRDHLCKGRCSHYIDRCRAQLNRCAFYKELYLNGNVDVAADYIYNGVSHGFDIVDANCDAQYICANYNSIQLPEFRGQMDAIVTDELASDKVSMVTDTPTCVHSLGAVRKASGKLRPITDCRRPLGRSINNYMLSTYAPFKYVTVEEICEELVGGEYMAVIDIKATYPSVNINSNHRRFQGFAWNLHGEDRFYTDNCICFGLRSAPYIFTQLTEFLVRCMKKRGFSCVYGYIDDFLIIGADDKSECARSLKLCLELLHQVGFYVSWEKLESPITKC